MVRRRRGLRRRWGNRRKQRRMSRRREGAVKWLMQTSGISHVVLEFVQLENIPG